jgi:alpha-L-fucosidase
MEGTKVFHISIVLLLLSTSYVGYAENVFKNKSRYTVKLIESDAPRKWIDTGKNSVIVKDTLLNNRLEWFKDMKFGLFIHFGIYSQWGCIESWPLVEEDKWARPDGLKVWTDRNKDMELFKHDYWLLNKTFNPVKFNPDKWAEAAKQAGMKYFVFTTKHHDGFCMYDTHQTDYKISGTDCPFHANAHPDIAKEAFKAFRDKGFGIGVYYSKADWHSPYYWIPDSVARTRNPNYDPIRHPELWSKFVKFVHKQIEELMTDYGKVDILWLDAGQVRPPKQDLQMDKLASMARKHQPGLIVVDRTVGGKYENYRTPEQEVPEKPLPFVWETCMTMGDQWSYKPGDNYKSTYQLIHLLVDIVAKGGNFLLNIGPQPDGQFPDIALSRLREIGDWMKVNSEAIYGTRPIAPYKEGQVAFTRKDKIIYAIYLSNFEDEGLPEKVSFSQLKPEHGSEIYLLGYKPALDWETSENGVTTIVVPAKAIKSPPCKHAYVFKFVK